MATTGRLACVLFALGFALPTVARPAEEETSETLRARYAEQYRRPDHVPHPAANRHSIVRESLGRTLFFDPRLSRSRFISCASCHNPAFDWGDGMATGTGQGMRKLGRRTPTILNVAWAEALMWDGRFDSLEEQALGPIASEDEMAMPLDEMAARVQAIPEYVDRFAAAYPEEPITPELVAKAIAVFERTIVSAQAPFDRWLEGDDDAISASARRGFALFNEKARCATCHSGWRFTDDSFHDIGVPGDDLGRGAVLPGIEVLEHAFKTPTLRNVSRRSPYMHDGSVPSLVDTIELYDRGGLVDRPSKSSSIQPLGLTPTEKADLVAFLESLTSDDPPISVPAAPM